jgi:hypothetical protein
MRSIGCESCETEVTVLTRSRSVTVRQREALWRVMHRECESAGCPRECSLQGLISKVSGNLSSFVDALNRHEDCHLPESAAIETIAST